MDAKDYVSLAEGIALMVAGWALPEIWKRARQYLALRLARHVFPAVAMNGDRPVIHVRASLDEVVFGFNPPTLRGYTHSGDLLGVMSIMEYFYDLPVQVYFDYFPEIKQNMKNVVVVGASSRSDVSRDLNAELVARRYKINPQTEHAYFSDCAGHVFRCEHKEVDGRTIVSKDVGIIFRRITDNGSIILLCAGIHTFGSQAAVEVAQSSEFQKKIRSLKMKEFVQFITVNVDTAGPRAGLALIRQSIKWKDLPLLEIRDQ